MAENLWQTGWCSRATPKNMMPKQDLMPAHRFAVAPMMDWTNQGQVLEKAPGFLPPTEMVKFRCSQATGGCFFTE